MTDYPPYWVDGVWNAAAVRRRQEELAKLFAALGYRVGGRSNRVVRIRWSQESGMRARGLVRGGLLAALSLFVMLLLPVGAASATDTPVIASVEFDIDGFEDLLLVEETNRLFVSGGASNDTLLVTDLSGTEVAKHTGLGGVRQMAYDAANDRVWLALADDPAARAYDATTGAFENSVSLEDLDCPSPIAITTNSLMVVGSECGDGHLAVVDLATLAPDFYQASGFANLRQLAPSPPPDQPNRVAALSDTQVMRINLGDPPVVGASETISATSLAATSATGPRRLAVGTTSSVKILAFDSLVEQDEIVTPAPIAMEWIGQPAVVVVNADAVSGFKLAGTGPFWSFPVAPAMALPNGLQAHSDGRLFIVAELPPDPGGGGGIGAIVPDVDEEPANLSGSVGQVAPAASGEQPDDLDVRLFDDAQDLVAVDSVPFGSSSYEFTTVQPGTYYVEFWALKDGDTTGYFPDRHSKIPVLSSAKGSKVVLASGDAKAVNADLRPLYYDMHGSVFENDILWMGNTGITKGCNPPDNTLYCTGGEVTRGQMAAFLVRALDLTDDGGGNSFVDDNGSLFEADIAKLAAAGITKGCNPPTNDRFCPLDKVTRGQMAAFLKRAVEDLWTGP